MLESLYYRKWIYLIWANRLQNNYTRQYRKQNPSILPSCTVLESYIHADKKMCCYVIYTNAINAYTDATLYHKS